MAKKRTALIVDDEPDLRTVLAVLLEEEGWATLEAEDGEVAVLLAAREQPDLILLDVMMLGKDGFEAYRELKRDFRTAHIPVIFLSAINEYDLSEHHSAESIGRRLGVPAPEGFIEKPFDGDTVRGALVRVFGE